MKKFAAVAVIVVLATMTGIVGFRLSTDALSIIVGAVLGMAAILPTIILVGYLLKKNQEAMQHQQHNVSQPPVVVVGGMMPAPYPPPQPQQAVGPTNPAGMLPPPTPSTPRRFHLMGYDDTESVDVNDDGWM